MKPYYEHAGITIYHGDCREVLPTLGLFDALVTDPPYHTTFTATTPAAFDALREHGWASIPDWLQLSAPHIRDGGAVYVFTNDDDMSDLRREMVRCGLRVLNRLTWIKTNPLPSYQKVNYRNSTELALYASRGDHVAYFADRTQQDMLGYWFHPIVGGDCRTEHPTQKPLRIIAEWILNSCPPCGSVLDPFCGSGTTLAAALTLGRRAIGIEIEERYCEIAAKRLAQECLTFD